MLKALVSKFAIFDKTILLVVGCLIPLSNWAQSTAKFCATKMATSDWLSDHISQIHTHHRNKVAITYLPLVVHNFGTDDGEGHYSTLKIFQSICRLNIDFEPYDIQFYLNGPINTINRTRYYQHKDFGEADRMMDTYNKSDAINLYITETAPEDACGYWLPSPDAINVIKKCMGAQGHTLTHEVGHYLALRHPFNGWEGKTYEPDKPTPLFHSVFGRDTLYVESVSGKNCDQAGDLICDTGPDYLSVSWNCNGSVSFDKQIDPFGSEFRSDGTNFMSYSNDGCQTMFSPMQVEVMHAYTNSEKKFLLNLTQIEADVSAAPITNMHPSDGEKVHHQSIEMSWDPPAHATHYLLQISRFSFFAVIDYEFIVSSNEINIGDLPVDKKYFWRVLPYNSFDQCADFSVAEGGFETVATTGIHTFGQGNTISVFPTLVTTTNAQIHIEPDLHQISTLQIILNDITGRPLSHHEIAHPRNERISLSLDGFPTGTYILQLITDQGIRSEQILKQ